MNIMQSYFSWGSQGKNTEVVCHPLSLLLNPKGNQSWIFIGRTDAEAETPILWPLDANSWLVGKDPDTGKDWRREEKGTTEDELVGWTWVWASSGNWWYVRKPGVLQSVGSHRVGHDWVTEVHWMQNYCHSISYKNKIQKYMLLSKIVFCDQYLNILFYLEIIQLSKGYTLVNSI